MRTIFIILGLVIVISLFALFTAIAVLMFIDTKSLAITVKISYLALAISAILFVILLLVYNPKGRNV